MSGSCLRAKPYNWPRLSPDGTRLVLQRVDGRRGTPDLWVKDLSRGTETRVTSPTQSWRVAGLVSRQRSSGVPLGPCCERRDWNRGVRR